MSFDAKLFLRVFSPRIVSKVLVSLDKSTAVVISACWLAALVMLILAVFAVHGAVSSKKDAAEAFAVEPVLPRAVTTQMTPKESQNIMDRLQRQFPDIKFESSGNQTFMIKTDDGSKFHQWITALSYVDTMAPQFRWTLREFCVGTCTGSTLMRAVVSGQKLVFSLPPR